MIDGLTAFMCVVAVGLGVALWLLWPFVADKVPPPRTEECEDRE